MRKLLLILLLIPFGFSLSFGQSWDWIRTANIHSEYSSGDILSNHNVAVDGKGNVYACGVYSDTISFGTDTLKGEKFQGIFLVKYNAKGSLRWVENTVTEDHYNGPAPTSVAVDKMGNVYITGQFLDTLIIGSYTLTTNIRYGSPFTAKYDSNGNVIWAKQGITPTSASGGGAYSIALDESGYVYILGGFIDTISFGTHTLTTAANDPQGSVFLIKYDANGNVIWAKQANVSSSKSWAEAASVATDISGNIYITGNFKDTVSFDSYTFIEKTLSGGGDVFVVKYNSNGNVLWAKCSESVSYGGVGRSIAVDGLGNCYITGEVVFNIIFGKDTLTGNESNFLVKYDANGNVIWAEQAKDLGNSFNLSGGSVSCDTTKKGGGYFALYGTGSSHQLSLKFEEDTFNLKNSYQSVTAIIHFDSSGKALCGTVFSEGNEDDGDAVGVDPTGTYVYFAGDLDDTTILGTDTINCPRGSDVPLIARWSSCGIINTAGVANENTPASKIKVFPNPNNGKFTLVDNGQLTVDNEKNRIEVYNILGQPVFTFSIVNFPLSIDLSNQPNGIYLYRVISQDGKLIGSGKVIIEK